MCSEARNLIGRCLLPALGASLGLVGSVCAQNVGMVCTEQPGDVTPTFQLRATDGYVQMPDGNVVYMWGYRLTSGGTFQMPGPVLCVRQGDLVDVVLTNELTEPVSIVFPGQGNVQATQLVAPTIAGHVTREAQPGGVGAVRYRFRATEPGTYLYESGTVRHKQVHMGLYGVLVVRPRMGANFAYNNPSTAFSDEFLIVLHEIDAALHQRVERGQTFNQTLRHDRYWTINGRSMPDVLQDNGFPLLPDQPYSALVQIQAQDTSDNVPDPAPILVRYANAGSDNHPFHPHGDHLLIIAQDGRLLGAAQGEAFTKTIAAGQTYDLLFAWENVEAWKTSAQPGNPPLPVEFPGLLDLVFADDVTWYSGDPHLGLQDALPPPVTSFSQCGEFYFPWHSHALHNVQNFDEGFGGMLTLVRVDPPGGCP